MASTLNRLRRLASKAARVTRSLSDQQRSLLIGAFLAGLALSFILLAGAVIVASLQGLLALVVALFGLLGSLSLVGVVAILRQMRGEHMAMQRRMLAAIEAERLAAADRHQELMKQLAA